MSDKLTQHIQQKEAELQQTIAQANELQTRAVYLQGYLQGLKNQLEFGTPDDSEASTDVEEKE